MSIMGMSRACKSSAVSHKNCVKEYRNAGGKMVCEGCTGGVPTKTGSCTSKFPSEEESWRDFSNCKVGSVSETGQAGCVQCQKNYFLRINSNADPREMLNSCLSMETALKDKRGCLKWDNQMMTCVVCDGSLRYYKTDYRQRSCLKASNVEGPLVIGE